jgi:hypothetical protein
VTFADAFRSEVEVPTPGPCVAEVPAGSEAGLLDQGRGAPNSEAGQGDVLAPEDRGRRAEQEGRELLEGQKVQKADGLLGVLRSG